MILEQRDTTGRLRLGYYKKLAFKFLSEKRSYDSDEFKEYVQQLGVLTDADWKPDGKHKHTWRHRIDRATQHINTGI